MLLTDSSQNFTAQPTQNHTVPVQGDDDVDFPPTFVEDFVCTLANDKREHAREMAERKMNEGRKMSAIERMRRSAKAATVQPRINPETGDLAPLVLTGMADPSFLELGPGIRGVDGVGFFAEGMRGITHEWETAGTKVYETCLLADDVFVTHSIKRRFGMVKELNLRSPGVSGDGVSSSHNTSLWETHKRHAFMVNTYCMECLTMGGSFCCNGEDS